MRLLTVFLLAQLAVFSGLVQSQDDAAAGKALYAVCAACHGARGEGKQTLGAPGLANLDQAYVAAQLEKFKSGVRGGEQATDRARLMEAAASVLGDDESIALVAAYAVSLPGGANEAVVQGDQTLGADYYNQFCVACHGAGGQGNPALSGPPLAGTADWYLLAQLQAFRSGARGAHPDDSGGMQMRGMAAVLPGEQALLDVVAYINGLPVQ
jgi:cytochrome c oxidase subunit 2